MSNRDASRRHRAFSEKLIFGVFDVHHPEHDRLLWDAFLKCVRAEKPDEIIVGGDFGEYASVSQHSGMEEFITLKSDFAACERGIADMREAGGDAMDITVLEGNHETRVQRLLASKWPQLIGTIGVAQGLHLDKYNATWVPEGAGHQPIARGTLDILHGHQLSASKGYGLPKYHAGKALELYGRPGRTVVFGHTHRAQSVDRAGYGGLQRAIGVGCMRTMDPRWLHGSLAGWAHQFFAAYIGAGDRTDCTVVDFKTGAFRFNGTLYVGARAAD